MIGKSMNIYMPLVMGFMAQSLASGLALYFLTSNLFGIVQYGLLGRANWSNIFPFLKKKDEKDTKKSKPVVVDAKVEDILDKMEEEVEEEEKEESAKGKRKLSKKMRPKLKK